VEEDLFGTRVHNRSVKGRDPGKESIVQLGGYDIKTKKCASLWESCKKTRAMGNIERTLRGKSWEKKLRGREKNTVLAQLHRGTEGTPSCAEHDKWEQ